MDTITSILHDISRCQMRYRADYMEQFGLKGCHASYIRALCLEPGISQEQLAKTIYANKSNIARQIAVLEEGGYVYRENDPADKRVLHVYPTQKARELFPLIQTRQEEWNRLLTRDLTEEEIDRALLLLQKMKRQADAFMEGKS